MKVKILRESEVHITLPMQEAMRLRDHLKTAHGNEGAETSAPSEKLQKALDKSITEHIAWLAGPDEDDYDDDEDDF